MGRAERNDRRFARQGRIRGITAGLLTLALLFGMTACGGESAPSVPEPIPQPEETKSECQLALESFLAKCGGTEETAEETALLESAVTLPADSAAALLDALAATEVVYPYADITNLRDSYDRYLAMAAALPWQDGTDYGGISRLPLKGGELLKLVKANNEMLLAESGIANATRSPLDDEYLSWICDVLTDVFNRELTEWDFSTQLDSIDWTIANLTVIRDTATFNNAAVQRGAIMKVNQTLTDSMSGITGSELAPTMTITHEGEHLLQSMSLPAQEALGLSQGFGFCYSWDDLPVNALYTSWFVEASAERLAANFCDTEPATYASMLSYLDSLTVLAALTGTEPIAVPRLSQQGTLEAVFDLFGRETEEEKLEFLNVLYAIQVVQQGPDDFWEACTAQTGLSREDEDALIEVQRNLKTAACLTMSRIFYENLVRLLTENSLTLRELFYLACSWEFDLNRHLGYEDETRLSTTGVFLERYPAMQQMFFNALAENLDVDGESLCELYSAVHCRARVPKTSMLHGDEIWDAEDIAAFSRAVNNFWDGYYQGVSQQKTVPVSAAAEILLEQ